MLVGNKYNWKNRPERLVYLGAVKYPGDRREWHQFAKIGTPTKVWCEVLTEDLYIIEETKEKQNG